MSSSKNRSGTPVTVEGLIFVTIVALVIYLVVYIPYKFGQINGVHKTLELMIEKTPVGCIDTSLIDEAYRQI